MAKSKKSPSLLINGVGGIDLLKKMIFRLEMLKI